MSENYKDLYDDLRWDFGNLMTDYRAKMIVLNQIWGVEISEPISDDLRITPELADVIIKNMKKIKAKGRKQNDK